MTNYLLNPSEIRVFPFGKTRVSDLNARVLNEQNITNLVRMLTDIKSYVISFDSAEHVIEFVLHGYYFKTKLNRIWNDLSANSNVYAYIDLGTTDSYSYLQGGDQVNVVSDSDGSGRTEDKPHILTPGSYNIKLPEPVGESMQEIFFSYTFPSDSGGNITFYDFYDRDNIAITTDKIITESQDKTKKYISGTKGEVVKFSAHATSAPTDLRIDVLYSSAFDGIKFTTEITDIPEGKHFIHLLEQSEGTLNVPSSSYVKFNSSSIPAASIPSITPDQLEIDVIYCGTSTELIQ